MDGFAQFRSTNTIMCWEKPVPMSIFTVLLDASIQNAFTIFQSITVPGEVNYELREFKRIISAPFIEPFLEVFKNNTALRTISTEITEKVSLRVQSYNYPFQNHTLLKIIGHIATPFFLCKFKFTEGYHKWEIYGFTQCRTGFPVDCFTF